MIQVYFCGYARLKQDKSGWTSGLLIGGLLGCLISGKYYNNKLALIKEHSFHLGTRVEAIFENPDKKWDNLLAAEEHALEIGIDVKDIGLIRKWAEDYYNAPNSQRAKNSSDFKDLYDLYRHNWLISFVNKNIY